MYKIVMKGDFATILSDGKELETLSGIYISGKEDRVELETLIGCANQALKLYNALEAIADAHS